ncbi:MAG: hypothetical protein JSR79_10720 [Proteobacteria bacterium]|nr:hypothetical protein [Pseudomonadota bacterium]
MDIANLNAAERIARVLAGQRASANADGDETSASDTVDATWRDHLDDAVALLKTLREPDEAMAQVGDTAVWEKMILAAIEHAEREPVVL